MTLIALSISEINKLGEIPKPSSEAARNRMRATKSRDTEAEMKVRRLLHAMGLRYFVEKVVINSPRRKADIVFTRAKVAVFIDGCFWHGCPKHGTSAKANAEFWRDKIQTNKERDLDTNKRLKKEGWLVIRAWEHENPEKIASKIATKVIARTT